MTLANASISWGLDKTTTLVQTEVGIEDTYVKKGVSDSIDEHEFCYFHF